MDEILAYDILETLVVRGIFEDNTTYLSIVYVSTESSGMQKGVGFTDVCSAGKKKIQFLG